ncbi:MAG: DUF1501 domain-containing protein [Bryobacteraceae bacterium]
MKDRFGFDWTKIPGTLFWRKPHLSRRVMFRHVAAAVGGYFLLPLRPHEKIAGAAAPTARVRNIIFIQMNGGASHVDTFDLKEGSWLPASFQPTSYGDIRWPRGLFPKLAEMMDSIAVVRSVKSWAAVHQLARDWVQIGRNPTASTSRIAPHIGSIVSLELSSNDFAQQTLPAFMALNTGDIPSNGYLAPQHAPFFANPNGGGLGNTTHRDGTAVFDRRYDLLLKLEAEERTHNELGAGTREMQQFNLAARNLMYNSRVEEAFRFTNDERLRYGNSAFGNACVTARNLLRAKFGVRFIQIGVGSFDNHTGIYTGALNPANANSLGRQFDSGLGNLIADLKQDGLLDETLVFCMGEFGRTIGPLNSQAGRDHFLQQAVMFAGGGIRGPKAIGVTDGAGSRTDSPGWSRDRDVRAEDIEATIYSALGIDWMTVRRDDPLGRGFEYVPFSASQDLYGPLNELWS